MNKLDTNRYFLIRLYDVRPSNKIIHNLPDFFFKPSQDPNNWEKDWIFVDPVTKKRYKCQYKPHFNWQVKENIDYQIDFWEVFIDEIK